MKSKYVRPVDETSVKALKKKRKEIDETVKYLTEKHGFLKKNADQNKFLDKEIDRLQKEGYEIDALIQKQIG